MCTISSMCLSPYRLGGSKSSQTKRPIGQKLLLKSVPWHEGVHAVIPIASAATRQRAAKLVIFFFGLLWTSFFSDDCNTPYFPLPQLAPAQLGNGKGRGRGLGSMPGGGRIRRVRRDTTSRYGPGTLAEMEAALREDRGMAEDAVT